MLRTVLFKALAGIDDHLATILISHPRARKRRDKYAWSTKVLLECFQGLVSQSSTYIALFIDGLNEYKRDT